jgi:hypothetical protein
MMKPENSGGNLHSTTAQIGKQASAIPIRTGIIFKNEMTPIKLPLLKR